MSMSFTRFHTLAGENGYYSYVFYPSAEGWQTIAIPGPEVPVEYYADWSAPAQSASGELDLTYTVTTDKLGLDTREKVDGAVIDIEPLTKSGTVDGGKWSITPAGKQTVTTSGHKMDDTFPQTGGDASATWKLHYEVSKTSTTTLSGRVGPYSSQAEADAAAAAARDAAIRQLKNEAQGMVDAVLAAARKQLATLQFKVDETTVPYGFEAYTGNNGSHQQIGVPANGSTEAQIQNDEWSLQVNIDKVDAETGQRIGSAASFDVFEWDTVLQMYIPNGGYNQYTVVRNSDGTYSIANGSGYTKPSVPVYSATDANRTLYYTQRNEGKFLIVERKAPSGYYGDWTDITKPGAAGGVTGKRAYFIEITKANNGTVIWLGNGDYNADIAASYTGGTKVRTPEGKEVTVTIYPSARAASRTYQTDPNGLAANENSFTTKPQAGKFQNTRVLGQIVLNKTDLDAMRYLASGEHGNAALDGAIYDLYAAENIQHPDGKTGTVDYAKIVDANGNPIWHTTVHTNSGWNTVYLPVLSKDNLTALRSVTDEEYNALDLVPAFEEE